MRIAANDTTSSKIEVVVEPIRAIRPRIKTKKEEILTHSDSVFFYGGENSFADQCLTTIAHDDINAKSTYRKMLQSDSTAVVGNCKQENKPTILTLTPRGSTQMRQYAGTVLISSLLVIVILIILKVTNGKVFGSIFSFISDNTAWRKFEDELSSQNAVGYKTLIYIYYAVISLFCVEMAVTHNLSVLTMSNGPQLTLMVFATVVILYSARYVFDRLIGYSFAIEKKMRTIRIYKKTSCIIIGLCLLPFVVTIPFMPEKSGQILTHVAISILISLIVFRIIRMCRINLYSLQSIFYFILYLCIAEVMPILCIVGTAKYIFG